MIKKLIMFPYNPQAISDLKNLNETVNVTEKERQLIQIIRKNKHISSQKMSKSLGVARSTITRMLKSLKDKGIVKRIGEDKNGYWEVKA